MNNGYFESEEFKETLKKYEDGIAKEGYVYLDSEDFMDVADYYLSVGKYDEAEQCIDMGISEHPDDDAIMVVKGSCCICQKKYEEAAKLHETMDSSSLDVMYQSAQLQYAFYHNNDEATKIWRKWMSLTVKEDSDKKDVERDCYMHVMASIMELRDSYQFEMSDDDKAYFLMWLDEYAEKFQPLGDSDYDEMIAETLIPSVFPEAVIKWYNQILERRPYMPRGWCRLAVAYLVTDKYAQCVEAADFALAINSDDIDALATKANALLGLEAWDESLVMYKQLREKGGGKIHNINMAVAYLKIGEQAQAFLCLKELKTDLDKYLLQLQNSEAGATLHGAPLVIEGMRLEEFVVFYSQVCLEIADKLRENGRFRESDKYLLAAAKYDADNYYIFLCLAENSFVEKKWTKCHEYFKKAMCCGDGSQRVDLGMKFSIYLLASDYDSMCWDILQKCDSLEDITERERTLVDVMMSYYYLKMADKEKFIEYFKKTMTAGAFIGKDFEYFFPQGSTPAAKLEYADQHFEELRVELKKGLSDILNTADDEEEDADSDSSDDTEQDVSM